jgi:hypothetical protein
VGEAKRETYNQSRVAAQGGGFTVGYGVEQLASFNRVAQGRAVALALCSIGVVWSR